MKNFNNNNKKLQSHNFDDYLKTDDDQEDVCRQMIKIQKYSLILCKKKLYINIYIFKKNNNKFRTNCSELNWQPQSNT